MKAVDLSFSCRKPHLLIRQLYFLSGRSCPVRGQYLDLVELQRIMSIPRIAAVLNDIMTVGNKIRDNHEFMRNLFALNFVALILRFFKSFTTNPRLDVVIQTIVDCTPNVAHFFIVYFSLFVSFAFAGHFLFGSILEGYSTALASLFTRYRKSMTFEVLNEMPVGHQILGYTWVWSYQLLMPSLILSALAWAVAQKNIKVPSTLHRSLNIFWLLSHCLK